MVEFGSYLFFPTHTSPKYNVLRRLALECEQLGFNSVWLTDHFYPYPNPTIEPVFECWTTLSALASETSKIRLGTMALCNSYRTPSVLAKMAATLDVISGGRLDFGIGAGWYEPEYIAYGIPFPKTAVRIQQLKEAIQIMKRIWTEEKATYQGKYYTIKGAINSPKPIQQPHPPIWIAGEGEKLTLRVVAELADASNFWGLTPEECRHKIQVLEHHCLRVNRNIEDIKKSWAGHIIIANNKTELKKKISRFWDEYKLRKEDVKTWIAGTPEQCKDAIQKYIKVGVTSFIFCFMDLTSTKPLRQFAEQIAPVFR